jgi:CSLREA domain-containing protein
MKTNFLRTFSLLFFICGLFAVSENLAATLTVTKTADTADNVCDADCSLREAVFASASNDTIVFSPLFNSPQTITLTSGQISINKNLTIAGSGVDLLVVSGNNAGRIFYISNNSVVALSGMKLKDGRLTAISDVLGGAIHLTDSILNLTNVTLSDNTARFSSVNPTAEIGYGGAIYSNNSTLSVFNSVINDNDAPRGGGIFSRSGIVNITNSIINSNSGSGIEGSSLYSELGVIRSSDRISIINSIINNNGGGVFNFDSYAILTIDRSIIRNGGTGIGNRGTATISNTLINNNRNRNTGGNGGGIFNLGTMNIISSAITNNTAADGGGIFNSIGQLFLTNSTVSGNQAFSSVFNSGSGGGLYNQSSGGFPCGRIVITNSTIANNRAIGKGGGMRVDSEGCNAIVRNTIIAGNLSSTNEIDVSGAVVSQGFNLIGNTTGSTGWIAADLLNRNPLLAPLGNNGGLTLTHALLPTSPAINAGNNALAVDPTTNLELRRDQRGFARFMGGGIGIVDIGAYELEISSSPVTLSGRVLTSSGRGIYNARITLTNATGGVIYAQTNPFGYYRFVDLSSGTTFTINVIHKRYQFNSPQMVTVDYNRDDFNFIAQ